nr:hypothetical protein GCM10025732_19720 [Glycomyces mayteni]
MPSLGEVAKVMLRHAQLLVEWIAGAESYEARRNIDAEEHGCREFRKHVAWYLKGFPVGGELRRSLAMVSTLNELEDLLGKLDADAPFPESTIGKPRGRTNSPARSRCPTGGSTTATTGRSPSGPRSTPPAADPDRASYFL